MIHLARNTVARVVLLALVAGAVDARAADNDACSALAFESARHVFHRAWFEQADAQLGEYIERCDPDALAHAYAAIIDKLLYRDNTVNVAKARALAEGVAGPGRLLVLALASFAEGELDETEARLRAYREAAPDDPYAAHVLGFTLTDLGRPAEGAAVLRALLQAHPAYNPARNHLAYALLLTEEHDEALGVVARFVAADPGNPSAWDTQADILNRLGRNEEAIASLARGLLLDERFAYGFRHMGDILAAEGNEAAAKAAYRKAIAVSDRYGPEFVASLQERLAD